MCLQQLKGSKKTHAVTCGKKIEPHIIEIQQQVTISAGEILDIS